MNKSEAANMKAMEELMKYNTSKSKFKGEFTKPSLDLRRKRRRAANKIAKASRKLNRV